MINSHQVRKITEDFLKHALAKYPKVTEVLLSHPNLPVWYDRLAQELNRMSESCLIIPNQKPLNPTKEVQAWAANYAEHAISKAQDTYLKQAQKELLAASPETM